LASLDKFAAEKVQEGSFSPGLLGDLADQTLRLSDKLRRCVCVFVCVCVCARARAQSIFCATPANICQCQKPS